MTFAFAFSLVHPARGTDPLKTVRDISTITKASWPLLLLAWASPAWAQPTARLSLTWTAPPGCPSRDDVQARINALLGGEASASSVADVRAMGQVERATNGFRLLLGMGVGNTTPSSRVMEGSSCDELAGAAAIAIALLARSTIGSTTAPSAAESTPSPPTPPADSPESHAKDPLPRSEHPADDDAPRAPAPPADARVHLVLDAPVGVVGWGILPSMGLGLGAAAGIRWKALRVVVGGELWQRQSAELSGFGARFSLQSARAEACLGQALPGGIELGPCAGVAVERLSVQGVESSTFSAKTRRPVWVSGMGGIFASVPIPGFHVLRVFSELSVVVSAARPRFVIDPLGTVHEPALAAPRLDFGCEWIL